MLLSGPSQALTHSVQRLLAVGACLCVSCVGPSSCGLLLGALCDPLCGGPLLCGPLCGSSRCLLLAAFCSAFLRHSFSVICLSFVASAAVLSALRLSELLSHIPLSCDIHSLSSVGRSLSSVCRLPPLLRCSRTVYPRETPPLPFSIPKRPPAHAPGPTPPIPPPPASCYFGQLSGTWRRINAFACRGSAVGPATERALNRSGLPRGRS